MLKFLKGHYRKRYHNNYQHAKKLFIFDLALFAFSLILLGSTMFLWLWKPSLTTSIDVSMSLGNERIKSGQEVYLTIKYKNKSKFKLNNVSLALHLPEGFIIDRSKTSKDTFSDDFIFPAIKEIKAGATGQAEIYGWFWSEPNKEELLIANLSYEPENNPGREQKLSSFVSRMPDSVLAGKLTMTTSTLPNANIKFTYTLTNSSNREVNNISVINNWNADVMSEKETKNILLSAGSSKVIEGQFVTPNKSGSFTFSVTPQVIINNHVVPQAPATKELRVFAPQVISNARSLENSGYAEPGQALPIEIKWQNKSDFKLQNITLHLSSNLQSVVDWKKTARENGAKVETTGIFFDSSSRTQLSNGNPGSADTFTVKIYLLPSFNLSEAEKINLEIYPAVKGHVSEAPGQQFSQDGSRARIPLATEVDFDIETRYYTAEGDQLGRGPLPPRVGKTTKYWILVKITNTTNAINEATFSTSLPVGVEFTGKQSTSIGPQLDYNNADRTISWRYNTLPANSQTGLYFEVSVTPSVAQIGQNILLTNSLQFSATDEFIGKKFNLSHAPLNNALRSDDSGQKFGSKVK
ncbi:MAG: Uncharacterized protein G01um101413_90 [Parcubacteria group bacterium Gr01-1014_13]|nr:MAG: Uncharacterized protein G01um101413_90 [Parcubacteria group bacterium Gr01-1014_13]